MSIGSLVDDELEVDLMDDKQAGGDASPKADVIATPVVTPPMTPTPSESDAEPTPSSLLTESLLSASRAVKRDCARHDDEISSPGVAAPEEMQSLPPPPISEVDQGRVLTEGAESCGPTAVTHFALVATVAEATAPGNPSRDVGTKGERYMSRTFPRATPQVLTDEEHLVRLMHGLKALSHTIGPSSSCDAGADGTSSPCESRFSPLTAQVRPRIGGSPMA